MNRFVVVAAIVLMSGGCAETPPTLAGGKPVTHWVSSLQNADAKVRRTAAFKLGNVGPTDAAVLPALLGALKDSDAGVRREAILALMKCGPDAREAAAALNEIRRRDPDSKVRGHAARALAKIDEESAAGSP
jgi:HEAT repeat protein